MQDTNEVEEKKAIIVFAGHVARELLHMGYTIIDIKKDNLTPIKSVFVFKVEGNLIADMKKLTVKRNKHNQIQGEK